jgi:hypothetical protein
LAAEEARDEAKGDREGLLQEVREILDRIDGEQRGSEE